jgi:hypothetical protein
MPNNYDINFGMSINKKAPTITEKALNVLSTMSIEAGFHNCK